MVQAGAKAHGTDICPECGKKRVNGKCNNKRCRTNRDKY